MNFLTYSSHEGILGTKHNKRTNMQRNSKISIALMGLALTAATAQGAIIGQLGVLDDSTGLVAGDQYRLAFVTSTKTSFASSDINFYNAFVQGVAGAAGYGSVDWKIIGSTQAVDARDNTGTNPNSSAGVPIFLMNGTTKIADDNADLWNGLDNPLNLDENGNPATGNSGRIITGSQGNGTESDGSQYLGNPTQVRSGGFSQTDGRWMRIFTENPNGGSSTINAYAMSAILTVPTAAAPIPEPSSAALVGLGCLSLLFRRRK